MSIPAIISTVFSGIVVLWTISFFVFYDHIYRKRDVLDMKELLRILKDVKKNGPNSEYHLIRRSTSWMLLRKDSTYIHDATDIIYLWNDSGRVSRHIGDTIILDLCFGVSTRKLSKDIQATYRDIIALYGGSNG